MRISPDNYIPRQHKALLRQNHMLNTHLPHFKVLYPLLMTKLTYQFRLFSRSNILIGHEVVGHHYYLLRVKDLIYPCSSELSNSDGGGNVIGQNKVYPGVYEFARSQLLFVGVGMITSSMTLSRIPISIASAVADLPIWWVLVGLLTFYFAVGFLMDAFSVVAMTIPILLPTLKVLEIDFVWFGIIIVLITMITQLTPPVGLAIFTVKAAAGDMLTFQSIFKGVTIFWIPMIAVLILLLLFPEIVLFLPRMMKGG